MIATHLTDEEIQLYAVEPEMISDQLKTHLWECAHCKTRAANYQMLFNGVRNHAKPQFDFDLPAFVVEKLPEPKRAFPWITILVPVFSVLIILLLALFFWPVMDKAIRNAPLVLITTALTAAVVILIFQAGEMVKNHQKKIYILLSAKILQL